VTFQGQSLDAATKRLTVLARLICFQMGWTVGTVTAEDGVVFAPLINTQRSRFGTLSAAA
jgi:hypothetical protein